MERECRRAAKAQANSYDAWFRRIYNLPPTDPRYLEATDEQIITDYWIRHFQDQRAAGRPDEEEFENETFDADRVARLMEEHPDDWADLLEGDGE